MTTKEALIAMRELLSDPKRWTKGALGRDSHGEKISAKSDMTVCWCLGGAALKIGKVADYDLAMNALRKLCPDQGHLCGVVLFNDDPSTTHADILRVLDAAIAKEMPC